ncbi:hypothetical protein [Nostoc sp. DSM 114167]
MAVVPQLCNARISSEERSLLEKSQRCSSSPPSELDGVKGLNPLP